MGEVIPFKEKPAGPPNNVIVSRPWEFRWADWDSSHFIQMLRSQSRKLEAHRRENHQRGAQGVWHLPSHFVLKDGMAHTVRAAFIYREREAQMREVYYLAGLVDCMINQVNPLLRTDLIRDLYKKVMDLKDALNVNWFGPINQVLLPIESHLYNEIEYREALSRAPTMRELYKVIQEGTGDMFDILSLEYVFYTPGRREKP